MLSAHGCLSYLQNHGCERKGTTTVYITGEVVTVTSSSIMSAISCADSTNRKQVDRCMIFEWSGKYIHTVV